MVEDEVEIIKAKKIVKLANQVYNKEADELLSANTCEVLEYSGTFDTCNTNTAAGSIKVEGWIEGKYNVEGYYCYAWGFLKIRFPRELDDPSFPSLSPSSKPEATLTPTEVISRVPSIAPSIEEKTMNPTESISRVPTNAPSIEVKTMKPTENSIEPSSLPSVNDSNTPSKGKLSDPVVTLETECLVEPQGFFGTNNFVLPCDYAIAPGGDSACEERYVKLVYTVRNLSEEEIKIQGFIVGRGAIFQELLESSGSLSIHPGRETIFDFFVSTDTCETSGAAVQATVYGVGIETGIPVSDGEGVELPFR